jgi:bacterioferritin-associated ferredoxin
MIVCVCKAVSDRQIRAAARDGATCVRDLSRELGLGTCCGKCVPEARKTLATSLAHQHPQVAELATFIDAPGCVPA